MNDSEFDQLLKDCASPVQAPASFTRDVWLRVETAESAASIPREHRLMDRIFGIFALPPVAVATCAAMVALGAWCGLKPAPSNPSAEVAYLQSVNPLAQNHR